MRNEINKNLLLNIDISEEMKRDIYKNCKINKRAGDVSFRYSTLLSVIIGVMCFCFLSVGVAAAAVSVKQRLEEMPEEEHTGYETEVENDCFVSTDEGYSRDLTDSEILRITELERDYYDKGVFPNEVMAHLETKAELADGQLAYVTEDNLVYLPEGEMTDEQLLQYIDHDAKKWYVIRQELIDEGEDVSTYQHLTDESTIVQSGTPESEARDKAVSLVQDMFGVTASAEDHWIILVEFFEGEEEYGTVDLYQLNIYRPGTGYADEYQIWIAADDMSPLLISVNGLETDIRAKKYSLEDAVAMEDDVKKSTTEYLNSQFGLGNPVDITVETEVDETGKAAFDDMEITYKDKTVSVRVRLEDKKVLFYMVW